MVLFHFDEDYIVINIDDYVFAWKWKWTTFVHIEEGKNMENIVLL